MKIKHIIASVIIFIFSGLLTDLSARDNPIASGFVPGQLIVKLREGRAKAGIKALNAKYKVISQDKVFKDAPNPQGTLKQLKTRFNNLTVKHDSWYWQIDKNSSDYKDYQAKVEKEKKQLTKQIQAQEELIAHLGQRQMRAPKDAIAPNLDNIYLFNTSKDINILRMARDYQSNPLVEYAEPNYIIKLPPLPELPNSKVASIDQLSLQTNQTITIQSFPQTLSNDTYVDLDQNGIWSIGAWGQSYEDLWGLKKIEADKGWAISQGEGVIVAVIDSGVDYTHEDLKDNIWTNAREIAGNNIDDDGNGYIDDVKGWDFTTGTNNSMDRNGHGTHIAGIIAAIGNNGKGIIGVAPKAKIMAVKGLDDDLHGSDQGAASAVKYAVDNGADILNNSWGGYSNSQLLTDTFHYVYSKGCVAIAAAGNGDALGIPLNVSGFTPANIDTVIAVSASGQNDQKCSFSNYGDKVDVSAPGGNDSQGGDNYNILSTMPDNSALTVTYPHLKVSNGYYRFYGTSMACPYVAGVAALILSENHNLTPDEVSGIIRMSADDIGDPGRDINFGYGRINALKAVKSALIQGYGLAIASPINYSFIRRSVNIYGSAYIRENFSRYEIYYASKNDLNNKILILSSTLAVEDGLLGSWDTTQCRDEKYILILKVISTDGIEFVRSQEVNVDNLNQPLVFINLNNTVAVIGKRLEFKVEAQDPDDPALAWGGQSIYSISHLPPGAQFDPQTQIFSWMPTESEKDTYEVTFTVIDNVCVVNKTILITTWDIKETEISNNFTCQSKPAIYQDKIVWEDSRNGNSDIYMYDLLMHTETQISKSHHAYNPAIYQDKIVWDDSRNGNADIYMYDLSTHTEVQITNSNNAYHPAIYQDKIVWDDSRNGNSDIYMYDLSTHTETRVTNNPAGQYHRAIYQDKIVWEDSRNGNVDIYMYDLSTHIETQVSKNHHAYKPAIYQDKIVWQDSRNGHGNFNIYTHDLSTHTEVKITNSNDTYNPAIYQDKIVWQNWNSDDSSSNISMYDLSKQAEVQIVNGHLYAYNPAIYQDKIVWEDSGKIHLAEIISSPQIISISLSGSVIISGDNFRDMQEDSRVELSDGTVLPVESWSDIKIICRVPYSTGVVLLRVVTAGGRSNEASITIQDIPRIIISNQTTNPITCRPDSGILFQAQVSSQTSQIQSVRLILARSTFSGERITHNYAMNYNSSSGIYETILYKSSPALLLSVSYKICVTDNSGNTRETAVVNLGDI